MDEKNVVLSKEQQNANRYALAVNDMDEVIQHLECYHEISLLHDADDNPRWAFACRALLSAAIVAYCRPFTDNKSQGFATPKLPISQLKAVRLRRDLHNLLVEKRNTFIAHADWSARSAKLAAVDPITLNVAFTEPNVWDGVDVNEFQILAGGVRMECIGKAFESVMSASSRTLGGRAFVMVAPTDGVDLQ
jgi:hypothetical protein